MAFRITFLVTAFLWTMWLPAQEQDPVLFSVEGDPVYLSEFKYIYEKTNGDNADYSRKSLEEYLDLYVRFKLKVQRAKDMQLDTIPSLQRELEGYRRQLADSYLIDKEVTDKLVREAYERSRQDVDISHILISLPANAAPEDTLAAYEQAMEAKRRLESGEDFAGVARELSQDRSAERNGGNIGYVTVLFPNGYYPMETAAYILPEGLLSDPVRTRAGYHILRVNDRRPARGEIEVAHILLRTKDADSDAVKIRIDSIHQALQNGADFGALARELSEDSYTAGKGGYIGFFGINRYEKALEDAAFGIEQDSAFSEPVQTSIGWHVVKRISHRGIQPFEIEKRRLEAMVKKDGRHEAARLALIEQIKAEAGFTENPEVLADFQESLTEDFLSFRWKAPEEPSDALLFKLNPDFNVTLGDFTAFLSQASRQRAALGRETDTGVAVAKLYDDFIKQQIIRFEEKRLEEKYPEFKHLMNEYEEGILLFEATQREVWNKASQDTAGLKEFYKRVKRKYRWDERAKASIFYLSAKDKDKIEELRAYAETHTPEEVLAHFNSEDNIMVSVEDRMLEKTKNNLLIGTPWQEKALSQTKENSRNNSLSFIKIEEIIPATTKTLDEARGYIIAEYQDYLEQQWVKKLRETYELTINEQVVERLIRE